VILQKFDVNMNLAQSVMLVNGRVKGESFRGVELFGKQLVMFTEVDNKKAFTRSFYVQKIDNATLLLTGTKVELSSATYEKPKGLLGKRMARYGSSFSVSFSKGEKYMLLMSRVPDREGQDQKIKFTVLDAKLSTKWSKKVTLPYDSELFVTTSIKVDDRANVYVGGLVYKEKLTTGSMFKRRKRVEGQSYKHHVIGYYESGKRVKDFEIAITDKYITDLGYKIADNGDLICTGFYSENDGNSIKGAYYLRMNGKTKKVEKKSYKEFGEDFITQTWSDRQKAKAKKKEQKKGRAIEMYEYDLRDLILRDDGGALLIAEQYYVRITTTTHTNSNGGTYTTTTYHYYYNDILVVNINPSGDIDWVKKIPKRHYSTNNGGYYSSFITGVAGGKIYFVFNDNVKNLNPDLAEDKNVVYTFRKNKDGICAIVTMDSKGKFEKEALFSTKEENIIAVPKLSDQTGKNEMVIFCKRKKSEQFAKLKLK
ncbi:MAG: hypothetical protein JKY54_15230, partial [Flavobacteriales bacterium]|nr:hypothetical protein [Flavobacteriales bacterium]